MWPSARRAVGTMTHGGQTLAIADGKVSKNTFTFNVTGIDEGVTGEIVT